MENKKLVLYALCLVGVCYVIGKNQKQTPAPVKQQVQTEVKQPEAQPKASLSRGVHHATAHDFDNYLNAGKPVVIDFYATWCGPCKAMTPLITRLEQEIGDKVVFVKVDVDQAKSIAQRYKVKAMPTFVFLDSKGNEVETKVGSMSYNELKGKAKRVL